MPEAIAEGSNDWIAVPSLVNEGHKHILMARSIVEGLILYLSGFFLSYLAKHSLMLINDSRSNENNISILTNKWKKASYF